MANQDRKEILRQKHLSPQQVLKDRVLPYLMLILAFLTVLSGLVLFVVINVNAVRNLVKYQNRLSHGATASATITRDWDLYSEDIGYNRWVEYSFPAIVNGKQTWVSGTSREQDPYRSLSVGQMIDVIYDVSDPNNNSLKENRLPFELFDYFALILDGFLVIIIFRYLIRAVIKHRMKE